MQAKLAMAGKNYKYDPCIVKMFLLSRVWIPLQGNIFNKFEDETTKNVRTGVQRFQETPLTHQS